MSELPRYLEETRVIAIIRGLPSDLCTEVAKAIYEGGIRLVEVTFQLDKQDTWDDTAKSIERIKSCFGKDICVGAGTVVSQKLVGIAKHAGAEFIVSPNVDQKVIEYTKANSMFSFPGVMTPSEVIQAHNYGADFVKLFPAASLGPGFIKAVKSPISNIKILAVGGINEVNAGEFIKAGCYGVGVGGNLANKEWVEKKQYGKITQTARMLLENINQNK